MNDPISALICSLTVFDTPHAVEDILQMTVAALKSDRADPTIYIHWARNRRLFCKELSVHTHKVLQRIPCSDEIDTSTALAEATTILSNWYPLPKCATPESLLKWLINDATAWNYFNLPRPLFADLCHEQPITPLSSDVLARRLQASRNPAEFSPSPRRTDQNEETLCDAICSSLFEAKVSSSSAWLITALLDALKSKENRDAGPRKSSDRSREAAIRSLSKLSGSLETADPTAALIFDFTLFMLNRGTARTAKGNVDLIRSYLKDLAKDLHAAITKTGCHPLSLTDEAWHNQLIALRNVVPTATRSKSIAALNKYLQSQLGIEAYLPDHGTVEQRAVHANVVWPNELCASFEFIKTHEPDERLQEQLAVILWIGDRAPIRIGEISLLQILNIRFMDVHGTRHVQLEIAPRRGLHEGKSTAARRIIPLGTEESCGILLNWLKRREKTEYAHREHFLFGDPHDEQRLYRFGRSIRSLNQTLKWATGDTSVSFHTLRHSVVTRMINQAFEITDSNQATARLQEIAFIAGHKSVATTLICYFHTPHTALRKAVDRKLAAKFPCLIGPPQIAVAPVATGPEPRNIDTSEQSHGQSPNVLKSTTARQRHEVTLIRKVLMDICSDLPPTAITSRCGISMSTLTAHVECALDITGGLLGTKKASVWDSQYDSLEVKVKLTQQRLVELGFNFNQPKLSVHQSIWSGLKKLNADSLKEVGLSWLRSFKGGAISLDKPSDCDPIIKFMRQAGVPAEHFLVRGASTPAEHAQEGGTHLQIQNLTHTLFDHERSLESVGKRGGRASRYLIVCRRPVFHGQKTPSAACRMTEVHSAFLVGAMSAFLQKKQG
ncbi:site-specific integrase [Polaromonas sp. YR568]|uniref:site-specific integrase n=1 Tax=Polaromonas sp. YR568 TaxID=1855301 RepID=UPI003137E4AA